MKKSQNSENSKETLGNANPLMKNNTTAPVEKESETIEFDMSRRIVEENINLKRQNKELKERLSYTDDIIIPLHFIFTHLQGYQVTPGSRQGYILHQPIFK